VIALDRGTEPEALARMRRRWLARAVLAHDAGDAPTFEHYDAGKQVLYDRVQHWKCAWCESTLGTYASVEHVRPKSGAATGDPSGTRPKRPNDPTRYWWLAWSWGNQLLACDNCNGAKWCWFACEPNTLPLSLPVPGTALDAAMSCFDLAVERPMLVDPTREDPRAHIVWRPISTAPAHEDLDWHPFGKTPRGKYTIAALKLDGAFKDHMQEHLRSRVWSALLRPLERDRAGGRYVQAKRHWREQTRVLFAPSAPYHAASLDALTWWSSSLNLVAKDFPLPRVGCVPNPKREVDLPDPPLLASQSDAVRLAVRAAENAEEAVRALCGAGAWTVDDLAAATEREVATVRVAVRAALTAGTLVHNPTTDRYTAT